jgi:hypothetical protein
MVDPFGCLKTQVGWDQRRGTAVKQVIEVRPVLTANLQDISKS